jgi:hypothetical protein
MPEMMTTVLEQLVEKITPRLFWKAAKACIQANVDKIAAYRLKMEYISAKFIDRPQWILLLNIPQQKTLPAETYIGKCAGGQG